MPIRRFSYIVLALVATAALWKTYTARAAEKPAETGALKSDVTKSAVNPVMPARFNVAKVDGGRAFAAFKKGDAMRQRFTALGREMAAARQANDKAKAGELNHEQEVMQTSVRNVMMDAMTAIAREKKIDLVLGLRPDRQGKPELEVVYHAPDLDVPDITDEVAARINQLAETRPALDSQPAGGAASSAPSGPLKLETRSPLRLQPRSGTTTGSRPSQ